MNTQTLAIRRIDPTRREAQRLRSLTAYGLADSGHAAFMGSQLGEHVRVARARTGIRFAALNIIGSDVQQTIAATEGVRLAITDRDESICGRILYATGADDLFVTGDARLDPDLWNHPLVSGQKGRIRFFAGAALIGREGLPLGMLCVFSTEPVEHGQAERVAARLAPVRDTVVALLAQHRSADRPTEQAITDAYVSSSLVDLFAAPGISAINAVIDNGTVRTLFQPIVHLETGTIAAFEALTRGPADTELESPIALLDAASAVGRLGELDWVCRASAMRAAAGSTLPAELSWFINVEPAGLEIECPQHLRPALDKARSELRVVLEVVERGVEDNVTRLLRATDQARRDAWGVALDDVGAEAESLALLPLLQPDVVKLDMSLLQQAPSAIGGDITAAVRAYAERTNAVILAEGIETPEQAELAKIFGATYGQGYLYGRPGPLPADVPGPVREIPLRQKLQPIEGTTPFEVLEQTIQSQRGRPEHLRHIFSHLMRYCERAEAGAVILSLFGSEAEYIENQDCLDALATSNAVTVCLVPGFTQQPTSPRHHVASLPGGDGLADQSAMIVVTPHFTGALVIRTTTATINGEPLVDFIYTHDRGATIAAARAYLDHLLPDTVGNPDSFSVEPRDNHRAVGAVRGRVIAHLTGRLHPAPGAPLTAEQNAAGNINTLPKAI